MIKFYTLWPVLYRRILLNDLIEGFFKLSSELKLVIVNGRSHLFAECASLIYYLRDNHLARYVWSRIGRSEAYVEVFIRDSLHDLILVTWEHKSLISFLCIFKLIFTNRVQLQPLFLPPFLFMLSLIQNIKGSLAVTCLVSRQAFAKVTYGPTLQWTVIELVKFM